ncbi:MAG TPA: cytochrome C [Nostocaceae cyanobacterium]|nr:cytochrome C [Nostocaceae cyanobacterium]
MPDLSFKWKKKSSSWTRSLVLILIVLTWSIAIGWLLSSPSNANSNTPSAEIGTIDIIPAQYQLGQKIYIENCSTCHLALPPAVFPTQTWKNLIQDSQHYGVQIRPLVDPNRLLVWKYISTFSRVQLQEEATPYRLGSSRYFLALHPGIKLPRPVKMSSCVTCHPSANDYNFRRLTPEWEQEQPQK